VDARLVGPNAVDDRLDPALSGRDEPSRAREAVASGWLADARMAHASVASFARLSLHLLTLGAPSELIEASQRASLDGFEHARICVALASRFSGAPLWPLGIGIDSAPVPVSLAELAAATVEEGCVGETLAALVASTQLERATDAEVRRGLKRIAADGARRASLSWQIVRWAVERGGEPVREAVAEAFERVRRTSPGRVEASRRDAAFLHEHGRLLDAEVAALREQGLRDVVGPCARVLLGEAAVAA
jgi:hypothetical protein